MEIVEFCRLGPFGNGTRDEENECGPTGLGKGRKAGVGARGGGV